MKKKIKVALVGATGLVGQAFYYLLSEHPYFELSVLMASDKREGEKYQESVKWLLPVFPKTKDQNLEIRKYSISLLKKNKIKIVFSALPAEVAKRVEKELAEEGFFVFSNSSAYRYEDNVPILIPEINPDSINLIKKQGWPRKGIIVTNSNCSTSGLALSLAPLRGVGIEEVYVSTYQAISGAGFPGLSAMEIYGNILPYIKQEEEKIKKETFKLLGENFKIYPTSVRVPVLFGHLETVWIKFKSREISKEDIISLWDKSNKKRFSLPSLPDKSIIFSDIPDYPQPALSFKGEPAGMSVLIGRLRKENNRFGYILLVNNLLRGAAGGSVLNAELFVKKYGEVIGE